MFVVIPPVRALVGLVCIGVALCAMFSSFEY